MKMDNNKHTAEVIESGTTHRALSPSKPMDDPIEPLPSDSAQLTPSETTRISRKDSLSQEKRKWDESFTVAEKKELEGNIVKAAKDNDGETYVTLQKEEFTVSSLNDEEEDYSQESDSSINKRPGRKPMPDEELSDSEQDPKIKRKAQNRAAQRAFRERKERYVKELEAKLKQVQDTHLVATAQLIRENHQLRSIIYRLEAENHALKGTQIPYSSPLSAIPHSIGLSPSSPTSFQQHHQRHHSTGSSTQPYPSIAPLLPSSVVSAPHTPFLLSAYLSPGSPLASSPIVNNAMLLASAPLHQYPLSPVIANAGQSISPQPAPTSQTKPHSPKKSTRQKLSSPPLNNQPLEYTFSISTPASLRPSNGPKQVNKVEAIEPVQLYPPDNLPPSAKHETSRRTELSPSPIVKKANSVISVGSQSSSSTGIAFTPNYAGAADDDSIFSDDKSTSTSNTQRRNMRQLELDMLGCHIDVEGQAFCKRLCDEVCNDAFDRLLSEPLFDQMGKLNLSISNYPVPFVTDPIPNDEEGKEPAQRSKDKEIIERIKDNTRLYTAPEIWSKLTQHARFQEFTTDQLYQAVKDVAKCSEIGPVLKEDDIQHVMSRMDQGNL
ncbi:hypothetical protein CU097_013066 [Rhizopus azygosporus]|uniref:BZIP domain-containing protein n=1 Tax=Rhizopus azygosporus TaxID=86630 RepID=A0A367KGS9_RHIAZ|nr:hypothetical protein CU097_013066 [Rhizopus azygosporus]